MRSDVTQFEMVAPATLVEALALLVAEPGRYTAMAGGTELMVALNTGRLPQRSFLSIQQLKELRFIRADAHSITIGAGATFTDIRHSRAIAQELPLLIEAASWTGTIANQNRATLGGNVCNASPAADTPPALLAYNAEITLISAGGERTIPYTAFNFGYKQTAVRPGELVYSITVPKVGAGYRHFLRKVGTRNALAISKVALAGVALVEAGTIRDIRLGAASLADRPVRCAATEDALAGQPVDLEGLPATVARGRTAMAEDARPIDDIRSTARYRAAVAANLIEEFLRTLAG